GGAGGGGHCGGAGGGQGGAGAGRPRVGGPRSRARRGAPMRRARCAVDVVRLRRSQCGGRAGTGMSEVAITGTAAVLEEALEERLDALPDAVRSRALRAERVTQLALTARGGAPAEARGLPGGGGAAAGVR